MLKAALQLLPLLLLLQVAARELELEQEPSWDYEKISTADSGITEFVVQSSTSTPRVDPASISRTEVVVSWGLKADGTRPRVQGYELQYLQAPEGEPSANNVRWETVPGQSNDTWVVSIRVDGYDASTDSVKVVEDGWFTLELSAIRPAPAVLPDLNVTSDPIAWNSGWAAFAEAIERPLRRTMDPDYGAWTVSVQRCDETEKWDEEGSWVGGCPYGPFGGLTWHFRLTPPDGKEWDAAEIPSVRLADESILGQWTEGGAQVLVARLAASDSTGNAVELIDPYFCRDRCWRRISGLQEGRSYLFRTRALNAAGMGEFGQSSTLMTLDSSYPPPAPRAPLRTSTSVSSILTVSAPHIPSWDPVWAAREPDDPILAYEFSVETAFAGDWISAGERSRPSDPAALGWVSVTLSDLAPAREYRFRVRARNSRGYGPWSSPSPAYGTPPLLPGAPPPPSVLPASVVGELEMHLMLPEAQGVIGPYRGPCYLEVQVQRRGSSMWTAASLYPPPIEFQECVAAITGDGDGPTVSSALHLSSYTSYRFRARAVVHGQATGNPEAGEWSAASEWARTLLDLPPEVSDGFLAEGLEGSVVPPTIRAGVGRIAANYEDLDYALGVAMGGRGSVMGGDGLVVIVAYPNAALDGTGMSPRKAEYFGGGAGGQTHYYSVPADGSVSSIHVKLWGGGGGGSAGVDSPGNSTHPLALNVVNEGGGGAFVQAELSVTPGEVLTIRVGGGGDYGGRTIGGRGGANGGAPGGSGGIAGAGGGGRSEVLRGDQILAVAAGGAGAGAADYCCAHGGSGGALEGSPGSSPVYSSTVGNQIAPPLHLHIDLGQRPTADYSTLAEGGRGGRADAGGEAGISGSFEFSLAGREAVEITGSGSSYLVTSGSLGSGDMAGPGTAGMGGRGANGKEGGGGGGGGFFGGGGGGSGVDGCGGGGGSSYVRPDALARAALYDVRGAFQTRLPQGLHTLAITHNSVTIAWGPPASAQLEPAIYTVEIARGARSVDYRAVLTVSSAMETIQSGAPPLYHADVSNLEPGTTYRLRVLGKDWPSLPLEVVTLAAPQNIWKAVHPRVFLRQTEGGGLIAPVLGSPYVEFDPQTGEVLESAQPTFSDPVTEHKSMMPSPRSGHSFVSVSGERDFLYLYGGHSAGASCSGALGNQLSDGVNPTGAGDIEPCLRNAGALSDLWRFDPMTLRWMQLFPEGQDPDSRNGFSTSMVGTKMYVLGGLRSDGSPVELDHYYAIDLDPVIELRVDEAMDGIASNSTLREGSFMYSTIPIEADGMCVSDMRVNVELRHSCTRQVKVVLFGPGPRTRDVNFPPSTFGYPTVLLRGDTSDQVKYDGCSESATPAEFYDDAPGGACRESTPFLDSVACQPEEGLLAAYGGLQVSGNWTLAIYDGLVDGYPGERSGWGLTLTMRPCGSSMGKASLNWQRQTLSGTVPSARAWHHALTIGNYIFVMGGMGPEGDGSMDADIYRLDVTSGEWVAIPAAQTHFPMSNIADSAMALTPWGLLGVGGWSRGAMSGDVRIFDPISLRWHILEVSGEGDPTWYTDENRRTGEEDSIASFAYRAEYGPSPRTRAAIGVLTGGVDVTLPHPSIFLFGGADLLRSYGDLWHLTLDALSNGIRESVELGDDYRASHCNHRLNAEGQAERTWDEHCGGSTPSGPCAPEELVLRAWCLEAYQSV